MKNKSEEVQKFENELKKLKLSAENGAQFFEGETSIPTDLEAEWLNHISSFEKAFENPTLKTIREILNNPIFPPVESLSEEQLTAELEKAYKLFEKHQIYLGTIYDVSTIDLYRFISTEFVNENIQVNDIPGMITHFTYEDFYPNDIESLKQYTEEIINYIFCKKFDGLKGNITSTLLIQHEEVTEDEFISLLEEKLKKVELKLHQLVVKNITIEDTNAIIECVIDYEKSDQNTQSNATDGVRLAFISQFGYWYAQGISIPSLGV